ncbi:MAG: amidohydrolase family protein [Candidatus Latescibacteria bacterium]|nr:amidohydrolase family protein [Candidatus Latescibacterota bacterium]NIO56216.1 amidohydrolase family protein [Candidatus Latescibacterota bacterium]
MLKTIALLCGIIIIILCNGGCTDPDGHVILGESEDPQPCERVIAIINGTLIDGTGADPQSLTTIVICDGLIEQVGLNSEIAVPDSAQIIDVEGKTVLPGFINAHVHSDFYKSTIRDFAMDGVTTLRDVGYFGPGSYEALFRNCDTLNTDKKNSHIVAAGPIVTTVGGYGNYEVTSIDDAARGVAELIDSGADLIKITIENNLQGRTWPMLSQAEIDTIVETAHAKGVHVSAHISRSAHLSTAVSAGVDDLAHMTINPITTDLVNLVVENDIYWVPTLELWYGVSQMYQLNWDEIAMNNLRLFNQAGGKVAIGTDFGGYFTPFDRGIPMTEVRLMAAAGMTPMQIIVAGTKNAAHVCGLEDQIGTIEEGKIADIIVLSTNPLGDLDALMDVLAVIHKGEIIYNSL